MGLSVRTNKQELFCGFPFIVMRGEELMLILLNLYHINHINVHIYIFNPAYCIGQINLGYDIFIHLIHKLCRVLVVKDKPI